MKLLIVRHAESQGNASGNYATAQADSLSDRGREQAASLIDNLGAWSFDKIIVSPLQRARQTISPYLAATHRQAEVWPEISEACWHEGQEAAAESWSKRPAPLPASESHLFVYRDGEAVRPGFPESFGMGLYRVRCSLELMQNRLARTTQAVLMVTHGHFIRELLNLMLKPSEPAEFPHDNCGMTLVSFNRNWTLESCNHHPRLCQGDDTL